MSDLTYLITLECMKQALINDAPGTVQFVQALKNTNTPFGILTSRSGKKSAAEVLNKLQITVTEEEICTTAMAASGLLRAKYPMKNKAAFLGGTGLRETLEQDGWSIRQDKVDFLFLSMDKGAAYSDYCWALNLLKQGAMLVVLDDEDTLHTRSGWQIGTGAIAAMLEKASGRKGWHVDFPDPLLIQMAVRNKHSLFDHTVLVDSRLDKGIAAGKKAGVHTVFLIDEETISEHSAFEETIRPDAIIQSLTGLLH